MQDVADRLGSWELIAVTADDGTLVGVVRGACGPSCDWSPTGPPRHPNP
jgi:hypothetical protein